VLSSRASQDEFPLKRIFSRNLPSQGKAFVAKFLKKDISGDDLLENNFLFTSSYNTTDKKLYIVRR
jgi:hypothetical protein